MDIGAVFGGYEEGAIQFAPTYRYDLYSDNYDTSEKFRVPAWTGAAVQHSLRIYDWAHILPDRILFRGKGLRLLNYGRAELKSSDHRPGWCRFDFASN